MTTPAKQPTDKLPRVFRGGGWGYSDPSLFRSAYRYGIAPANRSSDLGFRCAQRGCHQQILKVTP